MPVDLRHLRAFVAVAEELHFARAAARLGLEQSPLSRQIQDLEATLDLRLFHRNSRRTALTPLGERFLIDARRILYDTQTSIVALQRLAEGQGAPFRLGLAEGIAGDRFSRFLRAAAGVSPPISIVLLEQRQADLVALVATGGLEAAIVFDNRLVEGLNCEPAWSSPLVLGVALDHRLAKHRVTNLKEAREETWILPDPSVLPGYAWQVAITLARFQIRPERPLYAAHQTSMVRLAASGAGVALMGGSLVAGLEGFARLDLQESSRLTAWLVWRAAHPPPLIDLVRKLAAAVEAGSF